MRGCVHASSRRQDCTAGSTTEAEVIAASSATNEVVHFAGLQAVAHCRGRLTYTATHTVNGHHTHQRALAVSLAYPCLGEARQSVLCSRG